MLHRRRAGVGLIAAAVAIPLAIAATAFACANLAALSLTKHVVAAGGDVTAYGRNFNSRPQASAVELRFNGRAGRVLAEARPAANGKLTATFKAPADVRAGRYVIVATQTGPDGRPAAGTPGRAPLRIKAGASSAVVPPAGSTTPMLPSLPVGIGLAALMLGLAGGGAALVGGARRRSAAPAQPLA